MADLGIGAIPQTVGTTPEIFFGTSYEFRRFDYGVAISAYPLFSFPRGTNPAL